MKKTLTSYECDVCKWPAKTLTKEEAKEQGWLSISVECYYTDRSFRELDICGSCAEKIYRAFTKTMMPAKSP
jgi:hypothetical protein